MRYLKGNSTLVLVDDYCVVDIETSDASQERGDIIELSSVKVRNNEVIDTVMGVHLHDVPKNGFAPDLNHGLGAGGRFFTEAST